SYSTLFCVFADSIETKVKDDIISKEGESVTLSCSYDTSSNNVMLYWYRQYLNREPQFILHKGTGSWNSIEDIPDRRFRVTTAQSSTELTITSATLSDSALYYCALRVGAQ
uniref:Ig-like domain-containing protein n=1 Tax=Cyprinus carpio TaxID=7962 RepID=A0A8C1QFY2_CYPCA